MKKLFTVLSLTLLMLVMSFSAYARDPIRFGAAMNNPPMESIGPKGWPTGFDVDIGNEICNRMEATGCMWKRDLNFEDLIPGLKAGEYDAIISSLTITPERAGQIAFTDKLFNTPIRLIAKKNSGLLPNADSLKGKSIGVVQGTTADTYSKTNWAAKGIKIVSYKNQEQVYADLLAGSIDAALLDKLTANFVFLKTPRGADFEFAGSDIPGGTAAIGLRKEDTELKAQLNTIIAEMIKDGTYKRLAAKYFDFDIYGE
jgi:lysine/arginine/ornithine transport system substrate-binding protein